MPTVNTATTLVISPCLARICIKRAPSRIILPHRSAVQGCSTMGKGNSERHGLLTRHHIESRTGRVDPCFAETENHHLDGCGRRVYQTGSTPVGNSIASEVVRNYSDLPVMEPVRRRAEAVLLRYRYRQD